MNDLSWWWIAGMFVAPLPIGMLVATPLWRRGETILGNVAGTVVIFGSAFALIFREHVQLTSVVAACIDSGIPCFPTPDAFTRYAVYAFIALFEVIALFLFSLRIERKIRDRGYDPQWR